MMLLMTSLDAVTFMSIGKNSCNLLLCSDVLWAVSAGAPVQG